MSFVAKRKVERIKIRSRRPYHHSFVKPSHICSSVSQKLKSYLERHIGKKSDEASALCNIDHCNYWFWSPLSKNFCRTSFYRGHVVRNDDGCSVPICFLIQVSSHRLFGLIVCFVIEFCQLLTYDWLVQLRATLPGRMILGQGFLWSDICAYAAGVLILGLFLSQVERRVSKPTQ